MSDAASAGSPENTQAADDRSRTLAELQGELDLVKANLANLVQIVSDGQSQLLASINDEGRVRAAADEQLIVGQGSEGDVRAAADEQMVAGLSAERDAREASDRQLLELLNESLARALADAGTLRQDLIETMLRQRLASAAGMAGAPGGGPRFDADVAPPRIGVVASLDEQLAELARLAPQNVEAYRRCLDTGTDSYEELPPESCSTERHPQAMLFRAFVRPYLTGHVLDVGCGPQPVPSYLVDHPVSHIVGLDPISSAADHPFRFVSGFGEFLPFEDGVFDAVLSGTTLDHYYLLDRGLAEVGRVLKPGGRFLAWITEFAGAPPYDPYAGAMQPYDHEHMYHIDRAWFLPMMESLGFRELEVIRLNEPFNYLFMSFEKRS